MSPDFDASWAQRSADRAVGPRRGQIAAAKASVGYVDTVLTETGQDGRIPRR
jgi:hypothetical protein